MNAVTGAKAEQCARAFLEARGLSTVTKNFRCRYGELDLVMLDSRILVFVEVRKRTNARFASGAHSVDWRKQRRLMTTAKIFLKQHPNFRHLPSRFDVIAYDGEPSAARDPRWIRQAFVPTH